jgi:hypothetical protein
MRKMQLHRFYVLAIMISFVTFPAFAATVAVGNCRPNLKNYPTISQAVSSVPAGSTILVCPGIYREQVTITQPLSLIGVQSDNAANPIIAVPFGGLTQSVTAPANGVRITFQILVLGTESEIVSITNIAVDGRNNRLSGGPLAGIYYQNSSGVVNKVAVRNQSGTGSGFGIFLESTTPSPKTITVTNSSVHAFDAEGIRATENTIPKTITVNIRGNSIITANRNASAGMSLDAVGTISENAVINRVVQGVGIGVLSNTVISNNTVTGWGIWPLGDSNIIKLNRVSLAGGITISGQDNTVQYNTIANLDGGSALSFNCTGTSNTVTHNVINESYWGIIDDHGGNTITPNSFSNVTKIISPPC